MSKTVWVLYCYHNFYDQQGPTLEAVWLSEPTVEQVCNLLPIGFDSEMFENIESLNKFLDQKNHLTNYNVWEVTEYPVGVRLRDHE